MTNEKLLREMEGCLAYLQAKRRKQVDALRRTQESIQELTLCIIKLSLSGRARRASQQEAIKALLSGSHVHVLNYSAMKESLKKALPGAKK